MKMDIKFVMDYMGNMWQLISIISVGIIIGMVILPETIETGIQFLFIGFMLCYFWMSYMLWNYEVELMEEDEGLK